jgi:hypothetical protein
MIETWSIYFAHGVTGGNSYKTINLELSCSLVSAVHLNCYSFIETSLQACTGLTYYGANRSLVQDALSFPSVINQEPKSVFITHHGYC